MRINGNKSAHHNDTNEFRDAFTIHKEIYYIAVWYHDLYFFSNNIKVPVYEPPRPMVGGLHIQPVDNRLTNMVDFTMEHKVETKNIKEKVEDSFNEDKNAATEEITVLDESDQKNRENILEKNLSDGDSYLIRELSRLKSSSKEAIENADQFSTFKDYLHVDRPIQKDLEQILEENSQKKHGNLILLCGNVGDGKSHILAYLNKRKPWLVENYKIYNDATESFSPDKDALTTLEESLCGFSDQKIDSNKENIILAINMGVLHNFISMEHEKYTYNRLAAFIEESELFTPKICPKYQKGQFSLLSFSDYNSFELTEKGPVSVFYSSLLKKIVDTSEHNPFYLALKEDEKNDINTVVHDNYRLLQNENVQERIIQLVIQSIITDKLVISARTFLNFIADILIPNNYEINEIISDLDKLEYTLPNLLFNLRERSDILKSLSELDPLHRRSIQIDQLVIELNTLSDWETVVHNHLEDNKAVRWLSPFFDQETLTGYSFNLFFETFVRTLYLLNNKFVKSLIDESYTKYVQNLYHFYSGNTKEIKRVYEEFKRILFMWKGSPRKGYIYINKPSEKYRIAQKIHLKPSIEHLEFDENEIIQKFKSTIPIVYEDPIRGNKAELEIDYELFKLLSKVQNGYRPNKRDEENAIQFLDFIDKIMKFGDKKDELLVYFKSDDRLFSLKKDDFGSYVFERESNYIV